MKKAKTVPDKEQSIPLALLNKDQAGEPVSDTQDKMEGAEKTSSSETESSASSCSKKVRHFHPKWLTFIVRNLMTHTESALGHQ